MNNKQMWANGIKMSNLQRSLLEIEQSPKFPENARKVHFCNQELINHSQPKILLKLSKTPAAAFRLIRWIPAFLSDTVLL